MSLYQCVSADFAVADDSAPRRIAPPDLHLDGSPEAALMWAKDGRTYVLVADPVAGLDTVSIR